MAKMFGGDKAGMTPDLLQQAMKDMMDKGGGKGMAGGMKDMTQGGGAGMPNKDTQTKLDSGTGKGLGGAIVGLLNSIGVTGGSGGGKSGGAPNPFTAGDFDPEAYVGGNLANVQGGMGGIAKAIGGLLKKIGV